MKNKNLLEEEATAFVDLLLLSFLPTFCPLCNSSLIHSTRKWTITKEEEEEKKGCVNKKPLRVFSVDINVGVYCQC